MCKMNTWRTITRNGIVTKWKFWTTIKPFLAINGIITSNQICYKQVKDTINDGVEVAETLNNVHINVVENPTGMRPVSVFGPCNVSLSTAIDTI